MHARWLLPALLGLVVVTVPAAATDRRGPVTSSQMATCAEFLVCQDRFNQDLEQLRRIMGAAKPAPLDFGIRNAAPHEIYLLALTLFQRTNQLAFELNRVREEHPPPPPGLIQLEDAWRVVLAARRLLQNVQANPQVAESLALLGTATGQPAVTPAEPSGNEWFNDLFNAVLAGNRQLDQLLVQHTNPSDVYREVTRAISYAAQLLARYPEAVRVPDPPPFEPAKQPLDVYLRLLDCLERLQRIYQALGLDTFEWRRQPPPAAVEAGDVYLLAALLVAQLDHLHQRLGVARAPREAFYPGRKFPAHTYQRAALLQAQLEQLERLIKAQDTVTRDDAPAP